MKIYLVPFLLDFLLFLVQLRLADASGREMRLSNSQATSLLIAFNIGYLVVCPFIGRFLNARTMKPILLCAIALIGALSVPLLSTTTFWPSLVLIGFLGAAAALAFNAFQSLVRGQTPRGGLASTIAKYTVAWSLGVSVGFLLGGVIKSLGDPTLLSVLCIFACAAVFVMIAKQPIVESNQSETSSTRCSALRAAPPIDARYIAIGWSLCLAANFVQRPLAAFVPKFSAQDGNAPWLAGVLLCTMLFAQAMSGLAMSRKTQWLYQLKSLIFLQIGVIAVLGALWMTRSFALSIVLLACLGVLHGFSFFSAVFYVNNNARSARNVGINETMVAVGNISGMILCERAIALWGNERAFYPTTIAFSVALLGFQLWWLRGAPVAEIAQPNRELAN